MTTPDTSKLRAAIHARGVAAQVDRMITTAIAQHCDIFERNNPQLNRNQKQAYRAQFSVERSALIEKAILKLEEALAAILTDDENELITIGNSGYGPRESMLFTKFTNARLHAVSDVLRSESKRAHQASTYVALRTI